MLIVNSPIHISARGGHEYSVTNVQINDKYRLMISDM